MQRIFSSLAMIFLMVMSAYTHKDTSASKVENINSSEHPNKKNMKRAISIFEIPTTDFSRAVGFYQSVLDIEIQEMDMEGMQMGLFPSNDQMVSGGLIKGEGYKPTADGVVIYLDGGDDLQVVLDKVEPYGGQVIVPKTHIDEENGYFALFIDTEGNRLGLHSPE